MNIGTIRKLDLTELFPDIEQFRDHLLRLDKNSRRTRFAHSVSDSFIVKYAATAAEVETVIHGCFVDDVLRGVSELRSMGDGWGGLAEAAFSVEAELQDQGIATELMGRIIGSARNRDVTHLYVSCLAENRKMQRIAKKFDAQLKFAYGEVIGEMALFDNQPHMATAIAVDDVEVTAITRQAFRDKVNNMDPVLKGAIMIMIKRARSMATDLMKKKDDIDWHNWKPKS